MPFTLPPFNEALGEGVMLPAPEPFGAGTFDGFAGCTGVRPGSSENPGIVGPVTGGGVSVERFGAADGTGEADGLDVIGRSGSTWVLPETPDSMTAGSTDDVDGEPAGAIEPAPQSPDGQGAELDGLNGVVYTGRSEERLWCPQPTVTASTIAGSIKAAARRGRRTIGASSDRAISRLQDWLRESP